MNLNKSISKKFITLCAFFIITFCISYYIDSYLDDFVFEAAIQRYGGFIKWIKFFSENWGGRVIPQGLLVIILQFPNIIFTVINAIMWIVFLYYIVRLYCDKIPVEKKYIMFFFLVSVLVLIPHEVLAGAVFWKCANVLYLWGTAFAFMMLYPLVCEIRNSKYSKADIILAFIGGIYASSFEQIAAFMCVAAVVLIITGYIISKKFKLHILVLGVVVCVLTVFFTTMKGNHVRYEVEMLWDNTSYDSFSFLDKTLIGIHYAVEGIESCVPVVLLFLASVVLFAVLKNKESERIIKILSWTCFVFFLINFIHKTGSSYNESKYILGKLFVVLSADNMNFDFSVFSIGSTILNVTMITLLGVNVSTISRKRVNILIFLTYFGGIATMFIMGFSSTVYISGQRPMFIGCLFMLCCGLAAINDCFGINSNG